MGSNGSISSKLFGRKQLNYCPKLFLAYNTRNTFNATYSLFHIANKNLW